LTDIISRRRLPIGRGLRPWVASSRDLARMLNALNRGRPRETDHDAPPRRTRTRPPPRTLDRAVTERARHRRQSDLYSNRTTSGSSEAMAVAPIRTARDLSQSPTATLFRSGRRRSGFRDDVGAVDARTLMLPAAGDLFSDFACGFARSAAASAITTAFLTFL
jgi:hypothetical protein